MIRAREVLPSPGGPASRTWSSDSSRWVAAARKMPSFWRAASCPMKVVDAARPQRAVEVRILGALVRRGDARVVHQPRRSLPRA